MADYLVDHAVKHVWCTPNQDFQVIFKPKKVSQVRGDRIYITLMNQRYALPNKEHTYYVYQIGQVHPALYNLINDKRRWYKLSTAMRENDVVIDIYTDNGLQYPRHTCWMMVTENNNLLLAVRKHDQLVPNLDNTDLMFRFYSNAFFASERGQTNPRKLFVYGKTIETLIEVVEAQNLYASYKAQPGTVYGFINGYFHTQFNIANIAIGDLIELVYDSTVKQVIEIPIASMETFQSLLDNQEKYLVHSAEIAGDTIEYHDDIDFWLVTKDAGNESTGVYYHRNRADSVRMVTHKDYAIPSGLVDSFVSGNAIFPTIDKVTLRMHIRHSGYHRPLVDEHHRIKELYKLPDAELVRAMTGVDSTITEWKASELENSDYTRIMRQYHRYLTNELVTNAYGYNAISKLIGDSPLPVTTLTGTKMVMLPIGFDHGATVYEYDANGLLINFYTHNGGLYYPVRNDHATFIEPIIGLGSRSLSLNIAVDVVGKSQNVGYRLYRTKLFDGVVLNDWEDVTGSESDYTETASQFIWKLDPNIYSTAVRRDDRFLAYSIDLDPSDGVMRFSIQSQEIYGTVTATRPLGIPFGRLDLWLNGRALIEGIDYHVRWPEVCIINKLYRVTGSNKITIRGTGFSDRDLKRDLPTDVGYVEYGVLSRNNRFDIRDDKVMRYVVGGRVMQRKDIKVQEDTGQLIVQHPLNGRPYLIWDQVIPIMGVASVETYALRARSLDVDKRISDYLSAKLPEPAPPGPNAIPTLYPVISPFLSKIINDVRAGFIEASFIESFYSTQELRDYLASYETLLDFDPTQPERLADSDYCIVHPHEYTSPLQLTLFQWQFIKKVNEVYLYNRIDLTQHLTIEVL